MEASQALGVLDIIKENPCIFSCIEEICNFFDFDYYAFGIISKSSLIGLKEPIIYSNFPKEIKKEYWNNRYFDFDPVVKTSLYMDKPIQWDLNLICKERRIIDFYNKLKIVQGSVYPISAKEGMVCILSFYSRKYYMSERMDREIVLMSYLSHLVFGELIKRVDAQEKPSLTTREMEVMKCTMDGRSSYEISSLLKISESTVNFHVKNASNKLNCSNRVSATVKAYALGLIA